MKENSNERQLISQHKGNIIHLKTLSNNNIVTAGSDGQLHLYRRLTNQQHYEHVSCLKLFQSTIVTCDVSKNQRQSIVLAAFSGEIKICNIVDQTFIIVQKQISGVYDSPITSCIWGKHPNHLLVSTQLGSLFVIDYQTNSVLITYEVGEAKSKSNLTFLRRGGERLFFSQKNQIYEFEYYTREKKVQKQLLLDVNSDILDFVVSDEIIYNSLAVLTQQQLAFYLLAQKQPIKMSVFKVEQGAIGHKLGWGSNCSQLALYYCSQGKINTQLYAKKLSGKWNREAIQTTIVESNEIQIAIQMQDA